MVQVIKVKSGVANMNSFRLLMQLLFGLVAVAMSVQGVLTCDSHIDQIVLVVLLAPLLWLGWPCAAPPPPLLGVLRPIPFGVDVICDLFLSI